MAGSEGNRGMLTLSVKNSFITLVSSTTVLLLMSSVVIGSFIRMLLIIWGTPFDEGYRRYRTFFEKKTHQNRFQIRKFNHDFFFKNKEIFFSKRQNLIWHRFPRKTVF